MPLLNWHLLGSRGLSIGRSALSIVAYVQYLVLTARMHFRLKAYITLLCVFCVVGITSSRANVFVTTAVNEFTGLTLIGNPGEETYVTINHLTQSATINGAVNYSNEFTLNSSFEFGTIRDFVIDAPVGSFFSTDFYDSTITGDWSAVQLQATRFYDSSFENATFSLSSGEAGSVSLSNVDLVGVDLSGVDGTFISVFNGTADLTTNFGGNDALKAQFTIVPEPSTLIYVLFAVLPVIVLRDLRRRPH